jgi:hypothetical protein
MYVLSVSSTPMPCFSLRWRKIATELTQLYFPGIASLCRELDAFWYENSETKPRMEFGLFYTLAINIDMGERVKSIPHRDAMNLAWGICAIMPFGMVWFMLEDYKFCGWHIVYNAGFFPDGLLAWLVNHEANIVIQIPSGVFDFCLSSIITHYNVDRHSMLWNNQLRQKHNT